MAYTSIIPVHRLKGSVDYVLDEKKASRSQNADSLQAAVDYALNKDKNRAGPVSARPLAVRWIPPLRDMCHIKRMWHKEKGVQGFHLVQSFAAGGNAGIGHQIGQELAYRLLGGRFQVVISTHFKHRAYPQPFGVEFRFHPDGEKVPEQ